jgi:hypothetical protein
MTSPQKTRIRDSKKALFLCAALVELNLILLVSLLVPGFGAGEYLNALIILVSFYFTAEGSVDITRAIASRVKRPQT